MNTLDDILQVNESIHSIPSQIEHDWIIKKLYELGFNIHKVMWTNKHSEYPNIVRNSSYIGGNRSIPFKDVTFYKWISYSEWMERIKSLNESNKSEDWKEQLSKQFNEKVKQSL